MQDPLLFCEKCGIMYQIAVLCIVERKGVKRVPVLFFAARWVLFALSLVGWLALVSRFPRINSAFLPLVTCSCLTLFLFLFGMIHLLPVATAALFFGGFVALGYFLWQAAKKRFSFRFLVSPGLIFFFCASALLIPVVWGANLYHYDNFSHWGTVLEEMFAFRSFPTSETIVVFRDYAPASTSFLYFFGRVVGQGEDVAMMGQAMLSFAALSAIFCRVKKIRSFRFVATALLGLVLTCLLVFDDGTLQVYNLLVDALIGFVAAGIWFIREENRDQPFMGWLLMIPVMSFLVLIKKNAAVLLIFFLVFMIWDAVKSKYSSRKKLFFAVPVGVSLLWIVLWNLYRQFTYGTTADSYGYSGIVNQITSKPSSFFTHVFEQVWDKISDPSQVYVSVFLALNLLILIGILILRLRKEPIKSLGKATIAANALMVGYLLCMIFLYCFIMTAEASYLAAFERYMVTPLILFVSIGAEALFHAFDGKKLLLRVFPLVVSVGLFFFVAGPAKQLIHRPDLSTFERGKVMVPLRESSEYIPRDSGVVLYNGTRQRRDLYYYLAMYEVKSRDCFVLDFAQPDMDLEIDLSRLRDYEYLVVTAEEDALFDELRRAGYWVYPSKGCTLYRIVCVSSNFVMIYPQTNMK